MKVKEGEKDGPFAKRPVLKMVKDHSKVLSMFAFRKITLTAG